MTKKTTPAGAETISGSVDVLDGSMLLGWASAGPEEPRVTVEAFFKGKLIGSATADQFRGDLTEEAAFRLPLDPLPPAPAFLAGDVEVKARSATGKPVPLILNNQLIDSVLGDHVLNTILGFDNERFGNLLSEVFARRPAASAFSERLPGVEGEELSPFLIPVGHRSPGNLAIIGRQGHVFLLDGTNHLLDQYLADESDPAIQTVADAWIDCLQTRASSLKERGVEFRQVIIPEKSTALSDLYPVEVNGPTAQFAAIEKRIAALKENSFYVPVREPLSAHPERSRTYSTVDTHFSPFGCYLTHKLIMASLGVNVGDIPFTRRVVSLGDVGGRFPGAHLCSADYYPEPSALEGILFEPQRIELVEGARQIGTRIVYANPAAPVQKKVVAFANSFFELGVEANRISWWMSRWFSEFHFIWSPEVDYDYVDQVKPDLVIAQTIERFLVRAPRA